ncbi:hypothetical protein BH23ACT5_BH23ACT5_02460 [soil metagenome]
MLWLSRPPLVRWAAALCLVVVAVWVEFAPNPSVEVPFLTADVRAGEPITPDVVEWRPVADPGFSPYPGEGFAVVDLRSGDPLLASMVTAISVPPGWLVIDATLPGSPVPGSAATAVVLPAVPGQALLTIPGIVVSGASADPFSGAGGTLAVSPNDVAEAAAAAATGRLVVGVSP